MNNLIILGGDIVLSRRLHNAGYYSMANALQVVSYWIGQGKTSEEIAKDYHLGVGV